MESQRTAYQLMMVRALAIRADSLTGEV